MFTDAKDIRRFIKLGVFGDAGTGKTKFALSFPKPAVIDSDRGSLPYDDEFDFKFLDANHWPELLKAITWLEKGKHDFLSLIVDPMTVFYQDLVEMQVQERFNRSGKEQLIHADWGMIGRRWQNLLNRLIDLDMHVVLVMREKEEYESTVDPNTGQESRRRTGDQTYDAYKTTRYLFDYMFHLTTQENKKTKSCKFFCRVNKTRRHKEIAKFANFDITNKKGFDAIFKPVLHKILGGKNAAPPRKLDDDPAVTPRKEEPQVSKPKEEPADPLPAPQSMTESIADLTEFFGTGVSPDQPEATDEDRKVLFTRAGQLQWPDKQPFTSDDAKLMIKVAYKVDSSKELRKPQIDFLYNMFGKVLAGSARLERDIKGIPYVAVD